MFKTMFLVRSSSHICDTKKEADSEEVKAVNECSCKTLLFARHTGCYEDVADTVADIDSDCGADHGREDVSPIIRICWNDRKQQYA